MQEEGRWARLDEHLPPDLRAYLEDHFWRPIEAQATLEVLRDDPLFFADPGRHPAMFADHGVVHVRDVADGLVRLVDTVDGVLLASRPPDRRRFVEAYGVAAAYLHDIGMVDMTPIGRRTHPVYAAHAAFWPDVDPLVKHLLAPGPVRDRLDEVAAHAPFLVPLETVVREMLSMTAAHSKSTVPAPVLDDRAAFRRLMQMLVFTRLEDHRAADRTPTPGGQWPERLDANAAHYTDPTDAYAWLDAADTAQGEFADDVVDALRALRAADVLRQRGTALRTSGGYEVFFDARTADAVCSMRPANGGAAYLITYDDHRGAGEANIRVAFVTPQGHLRVAFHRGGFASGEVARRAAVSVAGAVLDIQADVIPSFGGETARGLPRPVRRIEDVRIQLERPDDHPAYADEVAHAVAELDPLLVGRLEVVASIESAPPLERARFYAARPVDGDDSLAEEIIRQISARGAAIDRLDRGAAFAEVCRATIQPGEMLVAAGTPPAFAYIPMGPGLVVHPGGGYAPSPLSPWVAVGTTGVIRRAERNADIVAEREVDVIMIPGEHYATTWVRPLLPSELRERLSAGSTAE
jgi:hypothetical protein